LSLPLEPAYICCFQAFAFKCNLYRYALANSSEPCQAELAKEGVLEVIKEMLQVVSPNTKVGKYTLNAVVTHGLKAPGFNP
jgi:hypothetical protein